MSEPKRLGIIDIVVPGSQGDGTVMLPVGTRVVLSDGSELAGVTGIDIRMRLDEFVAITLQVHGKIQSLFKGEASVS